MYSHVYQFCAIIITLSFVALVAYVIFTLRTINAVLKDVQQMTNFANRNLELLSKGGEYIKDSVKGVVEKVGSLGAMFNKGASEPESHSEAECVEEKCRIKEELDVDRLEKRKHYLILAEEMLEYVTFGFILVKRLKRIKDEMRH